MTTCACCARKMPASDREWVGFYRFPICRSCVDDLATYGAG